MADSFEANISANKIIAFLRARATLEGNTITAPEVWIEI